MNKLLPMEAMDARTLSSTPLPMASIMMTAPTPMTIPSMVKAERMRLAAMARSASPMSGPIIRVS